MIRFALFALALYGQLAFAQQPAVKEVVNAASDDNRLCPGVLAIIRGVNFGNTASAIVVRVADKLAYVESASPGVLLVQLPVDQPIGTTSLTVTAAGLKS